MGGVRLHHPTLRAAEGQYLTYVVELEMPYHNAQPRACPECGKAHERKSLHVRLDSAGDAFVSPDVLAKLQTVFMAGLEVGNEVAKPPPQLVGAVEQSKLQIVEHRLNTDSNAAPAYKPGRTKYQSRDRMHKALAAAIAREKK